MPTVPFLSSVSLAHSRGYIAVLKTNEDDIAFATCDGLWGGIRISWGLYGGVAVVLRLGSRVELLYSAALMAD
jgi:hypothetical protein